MNLRVSKIIAILFLALLLTGCWDYKEIEFLDFVMGFWRG